MTKTKEAKPTGTCQICGREIGIRIGGKIAHHGYNRPQGWYSQTASCEGARELAYEQDRTVLARHVAQLQGWLADEQARLAEVKADAADLSLTRTYKKRSKDAEGFWRDNLEVATFTKPTFEAMKEQHANYIIQARFHRWEDLRSAEESSVTNKIQMLQGSLDHQTKRLWAPGESRPKEGAA